MIGGRERERERRERLVALYLHVVEDEEQCLYGQPLKELERVKVGGRVLVIVVRRRIGISLKVGSVGKKNKNKTSKLQYVPRTLGIKYTLYNDIYFCNFNCTTWLKSHHSVHVTN